MSFSISIQRSTALTFVLVMLVMFNVLAALNTLFPSLSRDLWLAGSAALRHADAYAVLLVAGGILALGLRQAIALKILAIVILLYASHQLAMCAWYSWQGSETSPFLPLPVAFLLGWFALCCWEGMESSRGIRYLASLGWAAMLVVAAWLLWRAIDPAPKPRSWSQLLGIGASEVVGVFIHGLALLILASLARQQTRDTLERDPGMQEYRSLFSHSSAAVFHVLPDGTVVEVNAVAEARLGVPVEELRGGEFVDLVCRMLEWPNITEELSHAWRAAMNGLCGCRCRVASVGHEARFYNVRMVPIVVDSEVCGVFAVFEDISFWTETQSRLAIMERCLEESSNGVVILDTTLPGYPIRYANAAFCAMSGYHMRQLVGQAPFPLLGRIRRRELVNLRRALSAHRHCSVATQLYRQDGQLLWCQISMSPVRDEDGVLTHYVGVVDDISLRRQHEQQLAWQASHDALTGLPNRSMLADRLSEDVAQAWRQHRMLAVLFIDLDEFKLINDTLGHDVGDRLLVSVAQRLEHQLRSGDSLTRMGGDEFVLILAGLESTEAAEGVAQRLLNALEQPHVIEGWRLHVTASIGIAELDEATSEHPHLLIQRADIAMYRAKQKGRNQFRVFTRELNESLYRRLMLRNELQTAMDQRDLQLYYQPFFTQTGQVCGYEALLRWEHPELGWISPQDFIAIAEQTGQIAELGRWVLWQACSDARQLVDARLMPGRVSVNLSPLQFYRGDFLLDLMGVLSETGLQARWLDLELTEGALMRDTQVSIETLDRLVELGITTAIDDFGTGFSCLDYLQRLPVTRIKLDKVFIHAIDGHSGNAVVCKSVLALARELGLMVLAEGVETQAQYDYLVSLDCEAFQGFYFARPMPFSMLCELLLAGPEKPLLSTISDGRSG